MSVLERGGLVPQLLLTGSAADAPLFARRICETETEPFIIVGGGDGTINGVVNGLVPGRGTLGLLPLGTANVLAKILDIQTMEGAVAKILRGETRPLSVGLLEATGVRRYFFLMAGIGLDGAVVKGVRLAEKRAVGKGAYLLSALRQLTDWDRKLLEIRTDCGKIECHSVIVCNGAKYGGDFVLAPEADIFAPGFRLFCVKGNRRRTYLWLALAMAVGRIPAGNDFASFYARDLEVSGSKAVQVDGDYCCHAPLRITTVENFVRVIV
jgi:YegS/Rv2252/BmrU family lipid kinase